ncbi:MAG: trypsin-like peptidase domain-containing protein [Kiloniellales bacterium]|nr:trypsin-like peptidase domain-containing protein [Kiloniellales bacterium]
MNSVVSVLPLWPGQLRGGEPGTPPGSAPEGTAIAVFAGGFLATAAHVVDQATEITVRLYNGQRVPARFVALDKQSDIALLKIDVDIPVFEFGGEPELGAKVCAIGNQFGLDLSVTCGVVSATRRSGTGFNRVEDFIQTDAVVNPGSSGGALVDEDGQLVGMLSAIFTTASDADIGVNFAVSSALLLRVATDLKEQGAYMRPRTGLRLSDVSAEEYEGRAGAKVVQVFEGQAGALAGIETGDLVTKVGTRRIKRASDVIAAVALHFSGDRLVFEVLRDGIPLEIPVTLAP